MRIKTGKIWSIMKKGLRMGGILLMVLAVMLSVNMITVQAQGIHVAEDIDDNAIEREATKEAEEIKGLLESGAGSGSAAESGAALGTEALASVTPLGEELQGMADGTVDVNNVLLKSKMMQLAAEATDNTLNIGDGDIVLREGGAYTQTSGATVVYEGTAPEQKFTIGGTTAQYNITVESGARPEITLTDLMSDLSGLAPTGKSSIYIKKGAQVTLVLEDVSAGSVLTGSQYMPGIILEDGATLQIQGSGKIRVYGGGGAYAIGSNQGTAGGALWIGGGAEFQAYSNRTDGALQVKPSSTASMKRILQGTFASAQDDKIIVQAENRDKRTEKYVMELPKGYLSFSTSTTVAGGDYVSYIADTAGAEVKDSMLLADASNVSRHSYNLSGAGNTLASLVNLASRKITYTVTFDANVGTFPGNGQAKMLKTGVGYGTVIDEPSPPPQRNNHQFSDWHKTKDSFETGDRWVFGSGGDSVVRDTLIYASWKPEKCTVKYISVNNSVVKEVSEKTFGDTISDNPDNGEIPSLKRDGFTLVGWLAEDGSEWVFGTGGTTITKETTVLRANWLADCKVTFHANAGTDTVTKMPDPITVPATTKIPAVDTPERSGYQFIAWYTDAKCTKLWDMGVDTVTKSMTLYAGWGADKTKVTFHVNNGESVDPLTVDVDFGRTIPEPSASRDPRITLPTNYVVEGWYTDKGLTNKWSFSEGLKDSDGLLDLYVKWRQAICWATFQPNNADARPQEDQTRSVTYGESLKSTYDQDLETILAEMFTRTGYEVKSWTASSGKVWDMSAPLTGDIVLKAQWTPEVYTINFEAPNEEGCPAVPSGEGVKQITYGKTLSKPNYPANGQKWLGHTFQGWYTEEDGGGQKWKFSDEPGADKVEGPMILHAYWTLDEYTVSFQTYQGDENPPEAETGLHYGDSIPEPSEPSRDRYEFLGWMTEDGRLWDFSSDTVTGDMSLYAEWQGEPVDVILNVKYEPENEDSGKVLQVTLQNVRYGDFLTREQVEDQNTPETKKRPGYTLNGWYTGDGYQEEQLWNFAENQVLPEGSELMLYAHWTWDEYTVQFVTYKGDSSVPSQNGLRYGNLVTRPVPDPSRAHYTFNAWYIDPDIADETTAWDFAKSEVTGDMSLYASWIPDVYTLSFETDGGSSLEPVEVTYGTYVPADNLKTTRAGYVLIGWYRDAELTQPFLPASEYVDKTMTIYAKWELQKYTVRYHYRASEDSDEEEVVTYKEAYKVGDYLPTPNKKTPHKTLSSWYKDDAYQDKWVFKRDKVQGDTDLYAYWSDTEYTVHFETYDGTEIKDIKMLWGDQPEQPKDPVRTGYTFTGWFKDADGKNPWSFEEDFVDGDTIIYSGWKANMYTVSFDTAGGSEAPESQTVAYDSLIAEPAAPTKDGYVFKGWAADGKKWDFKKDTLKGDLTLTAQWSEPENPGGNPGDNPGSGGQNGSGSGNVGTASTGTGTQNSGTGTTDSANQALKDAANAIKEILTGDKAPLTYSIAGIILAAAGIIGALYKKIR